MENAKRYTQCPKSGAQCKNYDLSTGSNLEKDGCHGRCARVVEREEQRKEAIAARKRELEIRGPAPKVDNTVAKRVKKYTENQENKGLVRVHLWVPEKKAKDLKDYAAKLRATTSTPESDETSV